jgi:hypothetical protein
MQTHSPARSDWLPSVPLIAQSRRALRNGKMKWVISTNPTTPVTDGGYPGQSSAHSNRSHPRFGEVLRCVPALTRSRYSLTPNCTGQLEILCTSCDMLAFLREPAQPVD